MLTRLWFALLGSVLGGGFGRARPRIGTFFLGLPSPDLSHMLHLEAKYADSVAMSRALYMELEVEGKRIFTHEVASRFWLEHSDRVVVPSLGGVIDSVNDAWIKDVGRWSQPTSHEYVRTHLQRARTIQRKVAECTCIIGASCAL